MSLRINPWLLTLCLAYAVPASILLAAATGWRGLGMSGPDQDGAWMILGPALVLILLTLGCGVLLNAFTAARAPRGGAMATAIIALGILGAFGQALLLGWTLWHPLWWT